MSSVKVTTFILQVDSSGMFFVCQGSRVFATYYCVFGYHFVSFFLLCVLSVLARAIDERVKNTMVAVLVLSDLRSLCCVRLVLLCTPPSVVTPMTVF